MNKNERKSKKSVALFKIKAHLCPMPLYIWWFDIFQKRMLKFLKKILNSRYFQTGTLVFNNVSVCYIIEGYIVTHFV